VKEATYVRTKQNFPKIKGDSVMACHTPPLEIVKKLGPCPKWPRLTRGCYYPFSVPSINKMKKNWDGMGGWVMAFTLVSLLF